MARQNFIAKWLCKFGKDKYTPDSTRNSLQQVYKAAKPRDFDLQRDKLILFSDHHRGAKNGADDFWKCEAAYCAALAYYYEMDYTLCVMGDAEELWEEFPAVVLKKNDASFSLERRFHEKRRYLRLQGNHDEIWGDPEYVETMLKPLYGGTALEVPESFLLRVKDGDKELGKILLVHGHQGTQNEKKNSGFAKGILHNFWRPLQGMTGFSCNTPATEWSIRNDRDKLIYDWVSAQPGLVLIAGHTHTPVFASRSHRLRLIEELEAARTRLARLPLTDEYKDERASEQENIARLSAELEWQEHKLSPKEQQSKPALENPKPCYFNTGCCCFADGDITGIELADGEIRLVRWPDDNGLPARKILQTPATLGSIFGGL